MSYRCKYNIFLRRQKTAFSDQNDSEPLFGRFDGDGGLAPSCQLGAEASEKGLRAYGATNRRKCSKPLAELMRKQTGEFRSSPEKPQTGCKQVFFSTGLDDASTMLHRCHLGCLARLQSRLSFFSCTCNSAGFKRQVSLQSCTNVVRSSWW